MGQVYFLIFEFTILIAAFSILLSHNSIQSVLSLIIIFSALAALALLIGAEFLAFSFIIIYVGAVAILFLFVIMLLNIREEETLGDPLIAGLVLCILVGLYFLFLKNNNLGISLNTIDADWLETIREISNLTVIGIYLFSINWIGFLICGAILLIALIGAILLTVQDLQFTHTK